MSALNCGDAEELLGAYALEALPEDEARSVEDHLRNCAEQRATAVELQRTSALLPLAVEESDPSAELRTRIIEAIKVMPREQARRMTPIPPEAEARGATVVPLRRGLWLSNWARRTSRLALVAALAFALGIGGLVGYQLGHSGQAQIAFTFQGDPTAAPGAVARLVYFKDRKQAVVAASGLPRLTAGQIYEMWLIKGGVPVDEGISAGQAGEVAAQLFGDLSQFQQFAITIEPGEQPLPTTKPILVGNLHSG